MNKIFKLFSVTLMLVMMLLLSACESSIQEISEKYNIENEIIGQELTNDELLEKMKNIVDNVKNKSYGEVDIQNEISNLKVKFKYDFSGKDVEDFKVYLKYKSDEQNLDYFITNGVLYCQYIVNEETNKKKINLIDMFGECTLEESKENILLLFTPILSTYLGTEKKLYESLYDDIKVLIKNVDKYKVKGIIDENSNLIIEYEDRVKKRIVINEDNRIIYDGRVLEKGIQNIVYIYNKPIFNFPSTDGFIE